MCAALGRDDGLARPEDLDVAGFCPDDGANVGPVGHYFAVPCLRPQGWQSRIVVGHQLEAPVPQAGTPDAWLSGRHYLEHVISGRERRPGPVDLPRVAGGVDGGWRDRREPAHGINPEAKSM